MVGSGQILMKLTVSSDGIDENYERKSDDPEAFSQGSWKPFTMMGEEASFGGEDQEFRLECVNLGCLLDIQVEILGWIQAGSLGYKYIIGCQHTDAFKSLRPETSKNECG